MKLINRGLLVRLLALVSSLSIFSTNGYALVTAQALVGTHSNSFSGPIGGGDVKGTGTQLGLVGQIDPIPLVPVGFGLGVTMPTSSGEDSSGNGIDLTGTLVDLHVTAWTPIGLFGVTPYVKLGYVVFGAYKLDYSLKNSVNIGGAAITPTSPVNATIPLKSTGSLLSIGASYSLLPLISVLFEINTRSETLKTDSFDIPELEALGLNELGELKKKDTNILIGIEIGI